MLKQRDQIIIILPTVLLLLLLAVSFLVGWNIKRFRHAYDAERANSLTRTVHLIRPELQRMLQKDDLAQARTYCASFAHPQFRLSLIAPDGTVESDSLGADLDNHSDRREVREVLQSGRSIFSWRYSNTQKKKMIYHAVALDTQRGRYVLRVAMSNEEFYNVLHAATLGNVLLLVLSSLMLAGLIIYLTYAVYYPLKKLENSARSIADGRFDTRIDIPNGLFHELALACSSMAERLKKQLKQVTHGRNEKRAILDGMTEAVLLLDAEGVPKRCNHAAAALFSLDPVHPELGPGTCDVPGLKEALGQIFEGSATFEREWIRGGHVLFARGLRLDAGRKRMLLTVTDLTNQRKLESFRSDFIANVSHEIKTPLTCIMGAVEALQESPELPQSQREKLFDMLGRQSERLNALVLDILSLAAIERRQNDPKHDFTPTALDAVVNSAVRMSRERNNDRQTILKITHNEPLTRDADAQLLEQSLINLIANAVKYSESAQVDIALKRDGTDAVFSVTDYGIGITPEHQERIFERFYRVHKERSRASGGTGLGLAIVKHIAQLHGGKAEVQSTPGKKTVFSIRIPLKI